MYMKSHSKERVQQVCDLAGTKPSWFSLCARGHGKFSVEMAIDLEAASRVYAEFADDYMSVAELCDIERRVEDKIVQIKSDLTRAA